MLKSPYLRSRFIMKSAVLFFILLLSFGCSSKKEIAFKNDFSTLKKLGSRLQKTEKIQLYDPEDKKTKVLLTATYLSQNNINKKIKNDELFVVGLYIDDNQTKVIDIENFSLKLNAKTPKSIEPLSDKNKWLKDIPLVSEWSQYYLLRFAHIPQKSMILSINHNIYGKGRATFAKVAKYVLSKKAY